MCNMKKLFCLLLCAAVIFTLCACGKTAPAPAASPLPTASGEVVVAPDSDVSAQESPAPVATDAPAESVPVTLYHGDENCESIVSQEAAVPELTAQALVDLLSGNDIIAENVVVNSFTVDNNNIIQLDLSAQFSNILNTMGTSGEYIMLGSLVNTFMDAFDADGVFLTIDGKALETGHNIYDQTLGFFGE